MNLATYCRKASTVGCSESDRKHQPSLSTNRRCNTSRSAPNSTLAMNSLSLRSCIPRLAWSSDRPVQERSWLVVNSDLSSSARPMVSVLFGNKRLLFTTVAPPLTSSVQPGLRLGLQFCRKFGNLTGPPLCHNGSKEAGHGTLGLWHGIPRRLRQRQRPRTGAVLN